MTLSGATTLGQSWPGSNGNEEVFHILQISKAGASPSDVIYKTIVGGVLPIYCPVDYEACYVNDHYFLA